jgi:ABC-type transporter Mla subunit MlaD
MATVLDRGSARADQALTRATAQIADLWSLTNGQLGAILGVSGPTASRLRDGRYMLDPRSKAFELAQYLLRLFRSLDALVGSDDKAAQAWLRTPNLDLGTRPIDLLSTFTGLSRVCDYVDAFRARV